MSTGAEFVNLAPKRLMGFEDFGSRFLSHLRELMRENNEVSWQADTVIGTVLAISADGADKFKITGTSDAMDGEGHTLNVNDLGTVFNSAIQFENTVAIPYFVGLKYAEIPQGIQINPRTGQPEFVRLKEFIGEKATPNSVVNNGSTLTFVVDSVCEAGVSNAGRKVMVHKKQPGPTATTEAVAIETLTVAFIGGQNKITTAAQFGQTTVSTTATDYEVVLLGPTVKRNTDLRTSTMHTFVGIVTGVGAGGPPVSFNTADQVVTPGSLSQLSEITRIASNGRMKVEVKAIAGEVVEDQIRVKNAAGATRFRVTEAGDVFIEGNLTVTGQTTQNNIVQVNSSETITDNLTAGNAAVDSHVIKGSWTHTNAAGTITFFQVDGTTGRVGIGGIQDGVHQLKATGDVDITGVVNATGGVDGVWRPDTDNTRDLGTATTEWRDLFVTGTANIDILSLSTAVSEGLGTDLLPTADATLALGSATRRWANMHSRILTLDNTVGFGVGSNLAPTADNTFSIGTAIRRWANLFVVNLSFNGDLLPVTTNTQDIGSPVLRWAEGYFGTLVNLHNATGGAQVLVQGLGGVTTTGFSYSTKGLSVFANSLANGVSGGGANFGWSTFASNAPLEISLIFKKFTDTTLTTISFPLVNDELHEIAFRVATPGLTNSGVRKASITSRAAETWVGTATGTEIVFRTTGLGVGEGFGSSTDVIRFKLTADGHILPEANSTYDLGVFATRWRRIYSTTVVIGNNVGTPVGEQALRLNQTWTLTPDINNPIVRLDGQFLNTTAAVGVTAIANYFAGRTIHTTGSFATLYAAQVNAFKDSAGPVDNIIGLEVAAHLNAAGGTAINAWSLNIIGGNTFSPVTNRMGIEVQNITGAANNFALKTNSGLVQFGDNVVPDTDNTLNLGSPSRRWLNVHASNLNLLATRYASLYKNTTQTITATWADVGNYAATATSSAGMTINLVAGTIQVDTTGRYIVSYFMPEGTQGELDTILQGRVIVNGVTVALNSFSRAGSSSSAGKEGFGQTCILALTAGDNVRVQVQQRTDIDTAPATFSNIVDTAASSVANASFSVALIGL